MSRYLGKPVLPPYVVEADLLTIAADRGAGAFPTGDLYDWYVMIVRAEDREPVTKKWFGCALKEAGWANSTRYLGGVMVRCWTITLPWVRRGMEHVAS